MNKTLPFPACSYNLHVSFGLSNDNRFELLVMKPMTEKDWETFMKVAELFKASAVVNQQSTGEEK